jgi:hypothetical protein
LKNLITILALAVLSIATPAAAGNFYAGVGVGQSDFEAAPPAPPGFDSEDTAYKVVFGYNFNRVLSAEADYVDFGDFNEQDGELTLDADATAFRLFGVGIIPVGPKFDLYGKAGFATWDANVSITSGDPPFVISPDGTDFAWGFGAAFHSRKHWSILIEWEVTEIDDLDRLNLGSVGFRWEF